MNGRIARWIRRTTIGTSRAVRDYGQRSGQRICPASHANLVGICPICGATR